MFEVTVGFDKVWFQKDFFDGDLDIYTMNVDGTNLRRLTHTVGYDGGPFFSPDGSQIVYRASRPRSPEEEAEYLALLADGLVRPSRLEIWVMNADGSAQRQVTALGGANFAPFFHPDGKRIIFPPTITIRAAATSMCSW